MRISNVTLKNAIEVQEVLQKFKSLEEVFKAYGFSNHLWVLLMLDSEIIYRNNGDN